MNEACQNKTVLQGAVLLQWCFYGHTKIIKHPDGSLVLEVHFKGSIYRHLGLWMFSVPKLKVSGNMRDSLWQQSAESGVECCRCYL